MKVLPLPNSFIENMHGKPMILQGPNSEVQDADGMYIENDGVYCLIGIEENERELLKKTWTFFLGFHGPVPVFSMRINEYFGEEETLPDPTIPRIGNCFQLREEAQSTWGWMHEGYALPVGSSCLLETPEGWKPAHVGDWIYYDVGHGDFWILSRLFCNRMDWRYTPRESVREKLKTAEDNLREAEQE